LGAPAPASAGAPSPKRPAPPAPPRSAAPGLLERAVSRAREVFGDPSHLEQTRGGQALADDTIGGLFAEQLASGLWATTGSEDAATLMSTARALARAFAEGIDAAHSIYGAQVKKAIDAILALAPRLASSPEGERAASAALLAAFLVASGRRQKTELRALVAQTFARIAPDLDSPKAARERLVELTA
jgi:Ca-activated chloride channel family protein